MDTFIEAAIKVVIAFALLLVNTLILVWAERKIVADMQARIGPNRAGPFGLLITLADGLKLFFKEQITPRKAEVGIYLMAPILALLPALLIFLNIPIGGSFHIGDRLITLQGVDLNVGVLLILAFSSIAVYAVVLAGWSSGSKYPLLGGVRSTAQAISYETAMALSLIPVVIFTSSQLAGADTGLGAMSLATIVEAQAGSFGGPLPAWFIFPLVPSFLVFMIAGFAETNRAPFDLVEAEQELVGGFHTEYSGIRFAMFFLAEYINMFNISAIATTLFLGGWNGPTFDGVLPAFFAGAMPVVWFMVKTWVLLFLFIWVRGTLPRMRYDQLMQFGWKRLIPVGLAWLVAFTVVTSVRQFGTPWS
ncbi:MAG: NADH-quinone oxidoreductase subunit NuoH [Gammaproteobacteria bacterium]|nr:NADH-quinone oxidoreductase subunit NuoH [Gammaproteobacteria bacterium]